MKQYTTPTALMMICDDADILTVSVNVSGDGLKVSWKDLDKVEEI